MTKNSKTTKNIEGIYPLSPMQEGMIFHSLYEPDERYYFEQMNCNIMGDLDVECFRLSWKKMIERHSILRTSFVWKSQVQMLQVVHKQVDLPFDFLDWRGLSTEKQEEQLGQYLQNERRTGFNLVKAPLLRFALIQMDEKAYYFVWSYHHALLDGWSQPLLLNEFFETYEALSEGKELLLEPIRPYQSYIEWIHQQDPSKAESFWRRALGGFKAPTPLVMARNQQADVRSGEHLEKTFHLDSNVTQKLVTLAKQDGLTVNTFVLGAWALMLSRYSGQDDVLFGVTVSGRPPELPGSNTMIGMFINTLPMGVNIPADESVISWLTKLQAQQVEMREYEYSPLVKIREWSEIPSGESLFSSILIFENYPIEPSSINRYRSLIIEDIQIRERANYPLSLVAALGSELFIKIVFDERNFTQTTIEQMSRHLQTVIRGMVSNPDGTIKDLPLLTSEEKQKILIDWNETDHPLPPDLCAHHLFERQALQNPDAIAVVFEEEKITYEELNHKANQLAHYLIQQGVGQENPVGIFLDRSLSLLVGILGVLKAGGAYVPLDIHSPKERLRLIISKAQLAALISEKRFAKHLSDGCNNIILLDETSTVREIKSFETKNPAHVTGPGNLAYIIFTSGSTGEPKGVMLEHGGLVNLVLAQCEAFPITEGDRVLQFASVGFDASVSEVFTTLGSGATLFLIPQDVLTSPANLMQFLREKRINVVTLPPSLLKLMPVSDLPDLKTLVSAGEKCTWDIVDKWANGRRLINAYGPTEATVGPTYYAVSENNKRVSRTSNNVPIGRPIQNVKAFILDNQLRPVPVGVPGDLYLAGIALARGYLDQPELTKEQFIQHRFHNEEATRLYKTGDIACYLPDGNIEFLGRSDHQVKIRGFRVELEEIESVLSQHDSIQDSVVVSQEDERGEQFLVAYVIADPLTSFDITEIRGFLSSKLPHYMLPSFYKQVKEFPVTESGKVDRDTLVDMKGDQIGLKIRYAAPQTPYQELLINNFEATLGTRGIGIDDDFFEMGGHSLLVATLVAKIRKTFQVEIAFRDVFNAPTVRELSRLIHEKGINAEGEFPTPIFPQPRLDSLPLSFAQRRLWFLDQLLPGNAFYNLPTALQVSGDLNIDAFCRSLNEIVQRHEALRTTIKLKGDEPVQSIATNLQIEVPILDLSHGNPLGKDEEVQEIIIEEARKPFDLENGPLLRSAILKLDSKEHLILFTMHHIISDGWSMRVLIRELSELYQAFVAGEQSPLPSLPIQYADYAIWQRERIRGERLEEQKAYWRSQLAGSTPSLELPTDRPRPAVLSSRGAHLTFQIPSNLAKTIRAYTHKEDVTLFMFLIAAFQVLLYRYTDQVDINVGTPIANRNRDEIEDLIGFFVNTLVIRGNLSGNPSFNDFLKHIKEVLLEAYVHQDFPFEMLVEMLQPVRDMSHSPLFQVMFALDNMSTQPVTLPGLTLTPLNAESGTSKFDLTMTLHDGLDTLYGSIEYNTDLFNTATIERFVSQYEVLLDSIITGSEKRIDELEILSTEERREILIDWNKTEKPFPTDLCVHQIFEDWAKHTPEGLAVTSHSGSLTYKELDHYANQFANYLQSLGIGSESVVGLCLERTNDLVIDLLGVWKAGGAYLPLDPEYPNERLAYMLSDANAKVLVTQEKFREKFESINIPIVSIDQDHERIDEFNKEQPNTCVVPENLAYVIYTSGSTGMPKGVHVAHLGLNNVVSAQKSIFGVGPGDRILQFSSLSFDAATFECVMALGNGATLCVGKREDLLPGRELLEFMEEIEPTMVVFPPSALKVLPDAELPFLRVITVAGEACPAELVDRWSVGRKFYNLYGPTEDTIWATYALCNQGEGKPPIGKPIQNHQSYILDRNLEPVPIGVAGELFLGGVGVARGYAGRPALTAERFIPNPFSDGDRLYRTGDIARYRVDGTIDFLGREDDQVKLRGYRIELGEIEVALRDHPGIDEAVLMAHSDGSDEPQLIAYIVYKDGHLHDSSNLREHLTRKLPKYMIPGIFIKMNELPLLASGKIDRNNLPVPEQIQAQMDSEYVEPRNALEHFLLGMWQKIIRVDQIGIHDNFFELGGDSIRGAVFINQLEEILGESIYVAALFEAQTIAKLADYIQKKYPQSVRKIIGDGYLSDDEMEEIATKEVTFDFTKLPHPAIVPIQPKGEKIPLFCLHPAGGVVFPYYNLVSYLGYDQPLYGVQHPNTVQVEIKFSRVEDMASYYTEGLRIVQPHGPYMLAGWSSGGVVAFEMARILSRQGEKVAFLGIIDFMAPRQPKFRRPSRRGPGKGRMRFGQFHLILRFFRSIPPLVKETYNLLKSALALTRDGLYLKYFSQKSDNKGRDSKAEKPPLKDYLRWFWISAMRRNLLAKADVVDVVSKDTDLLLIELPTVSGVLRRVGRDVRMTQRYIPKEYDGDITLFTAHSFDEDSDSPLDLKMGWQNLTKGDVIVQKIPGSHVAVLRKPHVESFSQILKDHLDRARKDI